MNTHTVASLLFKLALACSLGLPAIVAAELLDEIAMVQLYRECPIGACDESTMIASAALVFPGGTTGSKDDRAPSWSPDGARLAFERNGEIYVIDVPGGIAVNVTGHWAADTSPAWSPDGTKIAFASDRDGQAELYLMNPDGTGVVRLTNGVGFAGLPAWSPDSGKIAFDCVIEAGNTDICAVNVDGTAFARLTTDPAVDS